MKIHVYGSQDKEKVLLLHPMLASSHFLEDIFERYEKRYCLIIPDLSSHGEDESDFHNIDEEANFLLRFLRRNEIHHLKFIYGASLGARLVMELIKNAGLTFDKVILDGLCLYENNIEARNQLTDFFLAKHEQARHSFNEGKKFLMSFYGGSYLIPEMTNAFMKMSEKSIINCLVACTRYEFVQIPEKIQSKFILLFGTQEDDFIPVSETIHERYPKMTIIPQAGLHHLEALVYQKERYLHLIEIYLNS